MANKITPKLIRSFFIIPLCDIDISYISALVKTPSADDVAIQVISPGGGRKKLRRGLCEGVDRQTTDSS